MNPRRAISYRTALPIEPLVKTHANLKVTNKLDTVPHRVNTVPNIDLRRHHSHFRPLHTVGSAPTDRDRCIQQSRNIVDNWMRNDLKNE